MMPKSASADAVEPSADALEPSADALEPRADTLERRRRTRLKLTYPVRIRRPGESKGVETQTEDLSCEGFYCISERPFSPQEWLECELVVFGGGCGSPGEKDLILSFMAEVLRVIPAEKGFGLACRFGNYPLGRKATRRTLDTDDRPGASLGIHLMTVRNSEQRP
jgi:hypothetical protein